MSYSTNNIFSVGLEKEKGKAAELNCRADLILTIISIIQEYGWTQREAAMNLGLTQPQVSNLMNNRIEKFNSGRLIACLGELGYLINVRFDKTDKRLKISVDPSVS